jgi:hypothetical protein
MTPVHSLGSAKGYQAPRCAECGHLAAEHQSAGTRFPNESRYGFCWHDGCDCAEYVEAEPEQAA